ncbi:Ras-related protein [Triplophysa tibetana]|uniref:Ras-related protein n=1 Tax=Triplophysa tibetana TaxID=1572043 RepID=A0A5A9MXS9_9TELE|nr:Ras-related protein [Triplophysa tibetana]
MSVLPPVRKDRIIGQLPKCFNKSAALHTENEFHSKVKTACQQQRTGTVGFCKDAFDKNYKATIGVDFEMERFEVLGVPFSLQLQWLEDAMKENDPTSVLLFLVGTKKDLSSPAQYSLIEQDAIKLADEMKAEYWALSALTGENVREFFFRVASLTFEANVMAELEKSGSRRIGEVVKINSNPNNLHSASKKKQPNCCQ